MFSIENLCEIISEKVSKELELDCEKKSVIKYGIFAIVQTIISIFVVVIVGFLLDVTIESLIISFTISILRKSSGGVHASSPGRCAVIGAIVSGIMGVICKNIDMKVSSFSWITMLIFIWSYFMLYKLAPVDSSSKPINSEMKKKKLKKKSLKVLSIYLCIILVNIIISVIKDNYILVCYSMCIIMGIIWQIFSLTKSGHLFFERFDSLLTI